MRGYSLLNLQQLGDERGELIVVEGNRQIPLDIKRIFYIYNTDSRVVRGQHANKYSEFVFVAVKGSCKVLVDNGSDKKQIILDKPYEGLYLEKMMWKEMYDFSEDCVLLVLSNKHYDATEYIRDYKEFLQESRKEYE